MADRDPVAGEIWPRTGNHAVTAKVLAVKDGKVAVDDPVLGLIVGTLAEFHGLYSPPDEPWRAPQAAVYWAAVFPDGTLGPVQRNVTEMDAAAARQAGFAAVVQCDVTPIVNTLQPL